MPRKPIDLAPGFLEDVRKRAVERRGKKYVPPVRQRGRPSKQASVAFHHMAELVAKYRDAGLPVRSELPKGKGGRPRDAIGAAVRELQQADESKLREQVHRAWNELGKLFTTPDR